jgi:phosphoglycerate dehydrogenase-like enzyme
MVAEHTLMLMLALAKRLPDIWHVASQAGDWGMPPRQCDENYFAYNWSGRTGLRSLVGATVGILGMAFKGDNDDKRDSLAYKLRKLLRLEARQVHCQDPYINEDGFISLDQIIRDCDILIIGCPHKEYKNLALPAGKEIVDIWNFLKK